MGFGLLGSDGRNNAAVCDLAALGYFFAFDEEDGPCSLFVARTNTLSKPTKFVGKGCFPDCFVGAFDEMSILLDLTGDGISY